MPHKKTVKLRLQGLDGNIFALVGAFARQARREGWTQEEIEAVIKDCWDAPDYDHALRVLIAVCEG